MIIQQQTEDDNKLKAKYVSVIACFDGNLG